LPGINYFLLQGDVLSVTPWCYRKNVPL